MEKAKTLGDFLSEEELNTELWIVLVNTVFHDKYDEERIERLTPAAQTIYLVGVFEGEMYNGGIDQFLFNMIGDFNTLGDRAQETVDALNGIGAEISANILKKAIALFPFNVALSDRQQRMEWLVEKEDEMSLAMGNLDDEFTQKVAGIGSVQQEDLTELRLDFMRVNSTSPVVVNPDDFRDDHAK